MSTASAEPSTPPEEASPNPGMDALLRAARVFSAIVAESVAQIGDSVTMPQLRAMVLVASRPNVNASAVAGALDIHPSNASRVCDRLVQAGILDRREALADRRNVVLSLTPAGAALLATVMEHRRQAFQRILARLSGEERHVVSRALNVLADAAGEPPEDALAALWNSPVHQLTEGVRSG